jgi:exodeoxyribonuclease V gamma subunit
MLDRPDLAPPSSIELREVVAYFKDPAKQVLAGSLNLRLDAVDESRLRDSEALEARVEAIDQVAKRLFNDAVAHAGLQLPESPPDWLRLTGVLPPGRAGTDAWNDELQKARALVEAAATHELFEHGLPRARPLRIEHAIDLVDGEALLRGELRRVYEKGDALWVMECYPGRDAESKLDFKPRIGFFLEWALLRLTQASARPVRACIVIAGEYDGWQHSFDAWNAHFVQAGGRDAADMLDDLERRVAALVAFWRHAQREPPWYLPATSWAAVHSIDKAREKWLGTRSARAERDYAPGYARLLVGDRDFSDGEDIAALHAAALQLRALIDLNRPLADAS